VGLRALEVEQTFKKGGNMTKQELIENVKGLTIISKQILNVKLVDQYDVIKLIEQLDEPQKVTIPRFIADWIVQAKEDGYNIAGAINEAPKGEVDDWLELENVDIFAEAWVNGYTIEKEKRYFVKMKELETGFNLLNRHKTENYWIFSSKDESVTYQVCHTRKELEEDGWGWVFDCPGVEVKEV
jgi:hypothetical protein